MFAGRLTYAANAAPVTAETIYDLASVTKLVCTTAVTMKLVADGRLQLDMPVADVLPEFAAPLRATITVNDLLSHTSGLPAIADFYLTAESPMEIRRRARTTALERPPHTEVVYSDIGMMVLGQVLETVAGEPLNRLFERLVAGPLGLGETTFVPADELRARIAPTECDEGRGGVVHAVVHDENAHALGGVAPHAGLFATSRDVLRFGQTLLPSAPAGGRLVPPDVLARFLAPAPLPHATWTRGFRRLGRDPLFGTRLSPDAVGLTGFTGTLLVIDREQDLSVALLSNAVHPTRIKRAMISARGLILDTLLD